MSINGETGCAVFVDIPLKVLIVIVDIVLDQEYICLEC